MLHGAVRRDAQHFYNVVRNAAQIYRTFHDTGAYVCLFHAIGALIIQIFQNFLIGFPLQPGILLMVKATGDNNIHAAQLRRLANQPDISAQIDGRAVHDGVNTGGFCLFQLDDRHFQQTVFVAELIPKTHPQRPVAAGHCVLVHQRITQFGRIHGAGNCMYLHALIFLLFKSARPLLRSG